MPVIQFLGRSSQKSSIKFDEMFINPVFKTRDRRKISYGQRQGVPLMRKLDLK